MPDLEGPIEYDVTIVGGGVAGCYVAYRLLHGDVDKNSRLGQLKAANGGRLRVGLFEYSGRVGGRLLSAQLPGAPEMGDNLPDYLRFTEFGGFRYQPQMHIVRDLTNLLSLTHQPFPVDEPPENPVYLRNRRFTKGDLSGQGAAATAPYNLTAFEKAIVEGTYAFWGTPDLDTFVANQAFASVLPNTPFPPDKPLPADPSLSGEQKEQLVNNGWFCLQQSYAKAFRDEDWAEVSKLQKKYEEVKQKATFQGRLFTDWPWWGLRSALLSSEAIAYEEGSGGYNSLFSSGNGPQGIIENYYFSNQVTQNLPGPPPDSDVVLPYKLFKPVGNPLAASVCFPYEKYVDPGNYCTDTVWKHVSEGYAAIPNELYDGFLAVGGNQPHGVDSGHLDHRNRQLLTFDKLGGGDGYALQFFKRESNQGVTTAQALKLIAGDQTAAENVRTKLLVMAMPKRSLDLLTQENFFFTNRTVQRLLDSVIRVPSQRLFMAYPRPWWTESAQDETPPTCGRSTTDHGLRQLYFWMTSKKRPEPGPSIVLASYTNGQAEEYWRGLQSSTAQTFDDLPGARPRADLAPPNTQDNLEYAYPQGRGPRAATQAMGDLAHRQFVELVGPLAGGATAPDPIYAHYQDWTVDPWGAGWHAWKAGSNDDEIIPRVMHPIPTEDVYICGEAWSNVQGWVQGALNTSETLVQRLGLAWPSWLQRGGTWLGPGSDS